MSDQDFQDPRWLTIARRTQRLVFLSIVSLIWVVSVVCIEFKVIEPSAMYVDLIKDQLGIMGFIAGMLGTITWLERTASRLDVIELIKTLSAFLKSWLDVKLSKQDENNDRA